MTVYGQDSHSFIPAQPLSIASPTQVELKDYLRLLAYETEHAQSSHYRAQLLQQSAECALKLKLEPKAVEHFLEASLSDEEFTAPLEALLSLGNKGRDDASREQLLKRLIDSASNPAEKIRGLTELFAIQLVAGELDDAHESLRNALDQSPESATLWLSLELLGAALGDPKIRLRGAMGRAAHAVRPEVRALLLERVARLHQDSNDLEAAEAALAQSLDEVLSLRALRALEHNYVQREQFADAASVVARVSVAIESGVLNLPEVEASENAEEQSLSLHLKRVIYHCADDDLLAAQQVIDEIRLSSQELTNPARQLIDQLNYTLTKRQNPAELSHNSLIPGVELSRALQTLEGRNHEVSFDNLELPQLPLLALALHWTRADQAGQLAKTAQQFEAIAQLLSVGEQQESMKEQALVLYLHAADKQSARRLINELPPTRYRQLIKNLVIDPGSSSIKNLGAEALSPTYHWAQLSLQLCQLSQAQQLPFDKLELKPISNTRDRQAAAFFFGESTPSNTDEMLEDLILSSRLVAAIEAHDVDALKNLAHEYQNIPFLSHLVIAEYEHQATLSYESRSHESQPDESQPTELSYSLAHSLNQLSKHASNSNHAIGWKLRALFLYLELKDSEKAQQSLKELFNQAPEDFGLALRHWLLRAPLLQDPQSLRDTLQQQLSKTTELKAQDPSIHDQQANELLLEILAMDLADQRKHSSKIEEALPEELSPALLQLKALLSPSEKTDVDAVTAKEVLLRLGHQIHLEQGAALETARELTGITYATGQFQESLSASLITLALAQGASRGPSANDYERLANSLKSTDDELELAELNSWLKPSADQASTMSEASSNEGSALLVNLWHTLEDEELNSEALVEKLKLFADLSEGETPDSSEVATARLVAAYDLLQESHFEEAHAEFKEVERFFTKDVTYYYGRLNAAQHLEQVDDQVHCLQALSLLLDDRQSQAAASYRAGVLCLTLDDQDSRSESFFATTLELQPDHANAFHQLYRLVKKRGDRIRLIELIDSRLEIDDSSNNRQQLLWAKSVYCRKLGRRVLAAEALKELLYLQPKHLAAIAMQAELAFSDGKNDIAADALKAFSAHPDLEQPLRLEAGLVASDLLENRHRPREAVELLQAILVFAPSDARIIGRLARAAARAGEWDLAYETYGKVAGNTDDLKERLRASQIRLAIQRDHLRTFDQLQSAARQVLRDSPLDQVAIDVVLSEEFEKEERERLLQAPLQAVREDLIRTPLSSSLIKRFSELNLRLPSSSWRLTALGIYGLIAPLNDIEQNAFNHEQLHHAKVPEAKLPQRGIEWLFAPELRGLGQEVMQIIGPALSTCIEPALEALGVSSLMKWPELETLEQGNSATELEKEVQAWLHLVGVEEIEIYAGGSDPNALVFLDGPIPKLVIGEGIRAPLTASQSARIAQGGLLASRRAGTLVGVSPQEANLWLNALAYLIQEPVSELFNEGTELFRDQIAPRAQKLEAALQGDGVATLKDLKQKWSATCSSFLIDLGEATRQTAARAATFVRGEPSILRQLSENLPSEKNKRNAVLASVISFSLSEEFQKWRQFSGLTLPSKATPKSSTVAEFNSASENQEPESSLQTATLSETSNDE